MPQPAKPLASVIIPVRNHAAMLRECLASLRRSEFQDFEIVVVDDASTEWPAETPPVSDVHWISRREWGGPATARNLGAQAARGEILVFLDADVAVHPQTLGRLLEAFHDAGTAAAFGSYDDQPRATNLVSQFRNLLHHHVHQTAHDSATTFWTGCGAIRRTAFFSLGGFDPAFRAPSIEDIELGARLHAVGSRIVVDKQAQATHLKRWTLASMCSCDLWHRGVPWALLILRDHELPNDLNLKPSQRVSVALAVISLLALVAAAWHQPWLFMLPLLSVAATLALDAGGPARHRLACLAQVAILTAFVVLGAGAAPAAAGLSIAAAAGVVAVNAGFYRFLARARGPAFAVAVVPLHLIFYVTCALAVAIAAVLHAAAQLKPAWPRVGQMSDGRAAIENLGPDPVAPVD
jgi:GT2 family glycosyltransferase